MNIVVSLGVLYITVPDVTGMPLADAETAIPDAPMDPSVSPGVWIGVDETPLEARVAYESYR